MAMMSKIYQKAKEKRRNTKKEKVSCQDQNVGYLILDQNCACVRTCVQEREKDQAYASYLYIQGVPR